MKTIISLLCQFLIFSQVFSQAYKVGEYLSPTAVLADEESEKIYIAEFTANKVAVFDAADEKVIHEFDVDGPPTGLAFSVDKSKLFVTIGSVKGNVHVINLAGKSIEDIIQAGHTPYSPVTGKDGKFLYVNNRIDNNVSVIDLDQKKEIAIIPVLREPVSSVLSRDGKYLLVANLIPVGSATAGNVASEISVIDVSTYELVKSIVLPNGSNAVHGITISADGRFAYAAHILGRYQMPTTQLERGWINTNALSIIDMGELAFLNTVLLDDIDLGAANPWNVKCSDDGKYICVSHFGTHEISIIDSDALHSKLDDVKSGIQIATRTLLPDDVRNDLAFIAGLRRRAKLSGLGPRGLDIIGGKLYVAEYYSGSIGIVDLNNENAASKSVSLGNESELSAIRRGEMLFHDASKCFQQWQSCLSCHPADARSDGLNWDLLNDGIGNAKNSKSLLLAHKTPPAMITGIRADAQTAVRAGIKYIQFASFPEEDASAIDSYLDSLEPVPSPYLSDGRLSESAARGKKVFMDAQCAICHGPELFTNLQKYDVGTGIGREKNLKFDTPTLIEVWRTAPYLYDGRAATMKEVFTNFNPEDKHGATSNLSEEEINDLVEYVLSQ
jgi:YVTN family beta-propeller protein